ncbi:MAG: hypothetical protein AAF368_13465, partial [Planctomycetota bacterium]
MSTSILPDDSLLIRHGPLVIHFDKERQLIHVRSVLDYRESGGSLLYQFSMKEAARVRIEPERDDKVSVVLEMDRGRRFPLGPPTAEDLATLTARVVAEITRCSFEIKQGMQDALPGPSPRFQAADTIDGQKAEILPLLKLHGRLRTPDAEVSPEGPTEPPLDDPHEDPFSEATEFDHEPDEIITGSESMPSLEAQDPLPEDSSAEEDELAPRTPSTMQPQVAMEIEATEAEGGPISVVADAEGTEPEPVANIAALPANTAEALAPHPEAPATPSLKSTMVDSGVPD